MGVIYKITNKINGKFYIGKTILTEPQRWQQHLYYAQNNQGEKDCPYLCNAILKYGKENFIREIIEETDNSNLLEREKFWIKKLDATNPSIGYNISNGGDGNQKFEDEEILQYYNNSNQNLSEASRKFGISRAQLSKRLQALGVITTKEVPIEQYDFSGKLINTFQSAEEAAKALNVNSASNINSKNSPCAYGYIWRRVTNPMTIQEIISTLSKNSSINRQIEQYSIDGELIQIYPSAAEAARQTNINNSCIKQAAQGKSILAGGFLWRRTYGDISYEQMIYRYISSPLCCAVDEIDEDGLVIATFKSANEAERCYGFGGNSVKPVCDGKKKFVKGKKFQWNDKRKREICNGIN